MIIDGVKYRDKLLDEYREKIIREKLNIELDIILIGEEDASKVYVKNKVKYSESVGIKVVVHHLQEDTSTEEVMSLIERLNCDDRVTGIILQSPTPSNVDFDRCASAISSNKDVDGFTKDNIDALYHNKDGVLPCTVKGIIEILEYYNVEVSGANVVIIGRGKIVGKPLALALTNRDATVTLCHSKTKNLEILTKNADILISAVGKPNLINGDMVNKGFIGIDVGINRNDEGKLVGDFEYESLKDKAKLITPVPGGVGPMTIAMIISNLIYLKTREREN